MRIVFMTFWTIMDTTHKTSSDKIITSKQNCTFLVGLAQKYYLLLNKFYNHFNILTVYLKKTCVAFKDK